MKYQAPLAALALSVCAWPLHAAAPHAEASSKITNLSIQAIDLVPSDDVAPSFSLIDTALTAASFAGLDFGFSDTRAGLLSPLTLDQARPGVVAYGSAGPTAIGVSLIADGEHHYMTAGLGSYSPNAYGNIRLAPGTALVISGTLDMALKLECPVFCLAETSAQVMVQPAHGGGEFPQYVYQSLNSLIDGADAVYSSPFSVTYSNSSPFYRDLTLSFSTGAAMLTVPEPTHLALLLAGLVTIGAMQRQRR